MYSSALDYFGRILNVLSTEEYLLQIRVFWIFAFLFATYLFLSLVLQSSTILNKNGKREHFFLFLVLMKYFVYFSLFSMRLAMSLLYITIIMVKYVPWVPQDFYHKEMLGFVKGPFFLEWHGMCLLSLNLFM